MRTLIATPNPEPRGVRITVANGNSLRPVTTTTTTVALPYTWWVIR